MLLWAIHDFLVYGMLFGCNQHCYLGCPLCGEETESSWLDSSKKTFFYTHKRFLPFGHKFRSVQSNFLQKGIKTRLAPLKISGQEIEERALQIDQRLRGKYPTILALKRKSKVDGIKNALSSRSILFDLPYWKEHSVLHVI